MRYLVIAGFYLAIFAASVGCDVASSKPHQSASIETVTQPVVTGDANEITTAVKTQIKQVQNEVLPWLLVVGIVVLAGCGLIVTMLAMGFWLLRKWIERNNYLALKPIYEGTCKANGTKP